MSLGAWLLLSLVVSRPTFAQVQPGLSHLLDQVQASQRQALRQGRVGVFSHVPAVTPDGRNAVQALLEAGVNVTAVFAAEHGFAANGLAGISIGNGELVYNGRKIPLYSLYGQNGRKPTKKMLDQTDVIIVDFQDVGARFYTYAGSMLYMMQVAGALGKPVIVLDRPNPLGGEMVGGRISDREGFKPSLTNPYPMPLVHGMTMGEIARLFNGEYSLGVSLEIVPMKGWTRHMLFDATGLRWVPPSPNIPRWDTALAYPGLETLAAAETGISVGRGLNQGSDPKAFKVVGAPWINDAADLSGKLNALGLADVAFVPTEFTPGKEDPYEGQLCRGVELKLKGGHLSDPMLPAMAVLHVLSNEYPNEEFWRRSKGTFALNFFSKSQRDQMRDAGRNPNEAVMADLRDWGKVKALVESWKSDAGEFNNIRSKYLIYGSAGQPAVSLPTQASAGGVAPQVVPHAVQSAPATLPATADQQSELIRNLFGQ